jgi:PAS domain S-box-containing protein
VLRRIGIGSLAFALVVLAATVWTSYVSFSESHRGRLAARRTREFVQDVDSLLSELKDAESGQRGFLLTGNPQYLEPFQAALPEIASDLQSLRQFAAFHEHQRPFVGRLSVETDTKLVELKRTIEVYRTQGAHAALQVVDTNQGKRSMDRIRQLCSAAVRSEESELNEASTNSEADQNLASGIAVSGSILLLCLLTLGLLALRSALRLTEKLASDVETARQSLETTLMSIGDGVIGTDSDGRILFLNAVAEELTGWCQEDAKARRLEEVFEIVNEDTREVVESPATKVLRTGAIAGLANHTLLIRKDRSELAIDDGGAPIRDPQGRISGVVLVFRDITERRRMERELTDSNEMLLRTNEELQEFAYAASHDLQEPLRTILIYSELIERDCRDQLDGRARELLQQVLDNGRRMRGLIEDLLLYSRSGLSDVTLRPVAGEVILDQALQTLRGIIEQVGATITRDPLPVIVGNDAQLSQVFQNLLSNAIKYRKPEERPRIHISASSTEGQATFRVQDNGIGFNQRYADQIFGLFKRLHGRSIPGSGIGLALCRRIIDRHRGRIWAESQPGEGTAFLFTLPVAGQQVERAAGSE